ncbi:hypothetical protein CDCA_CDCA09G2588 [Cyanidium caldarium]|uniref:Rho-GAP domain-containing protein n=1 Tax=Cyanidium caldarium TaxID=2771 RepID=A0AAV9IW98_CYACA|nr:hypothetical protein CDCA_CDCA09G2588 [Cyanidium caldarium]
MSTGEVVWSMLHRDETGWASTPRQGPANPTEQRQSGELAAKSVENGDPGIESPVTMIQLRGGPAAGAAGPGQSGPLVRREVAARIRQILRRGLGRLEGRRPAPSASSPEPETGCFCVRSGTSDTAGEAKEASPDPDTERLSHSALAVEPVRHWDADIERRVSLCIQCLMESRCLETAGIFGASGSVEAIERLREQLSAGTTAIPAQTSPHTVVGLLKETLRCTRPTLLSPGVYRCYLSMARESSVARTWEEAINMFRLWQRVAADSPTSRRKELLLDLLLLLRQVSLMSASNKMTSRNLAMVMAPCTCDWDPLKSNALEQLHVMTDMLQYLIDKAEALAELEGRVPQLARDRPAAVTVSPGAEDQTTTSAFYEGDPPSAASSLLVAGISKLSPLRGHNGSRDERTEK